MPIDTSDLIPKPSLTLLSILRTLKVRSVNGSLDEQRVAAKCERRACKKPFGCRFASCRRHGDCQLAALAGYPWTVYGKAPGSPGYYDALQDRYRHIGWRRDEVAEAARKKSGE